MVEQDKKDRDDVIKGYFAGLIVACLLVIISYLISIYCPFFILWIQFIEISSYAFIAAALYGQRGWEIQTYSGKTDAEKWNKWLFRILSTLGIGLSMFAIFLK